MDELKTWLESEIRIEAEKLLEFSRLKGLHVQEIRSEERMNTFKDVLEKINTSK